MKISCDVIEDLLPLYVDDMVRGRKVWQTRKEKQ